MARRIEKVNELLQQELAKLIQQEFADELGMINVNLVQTTSDLREAKVYLSAVNRKILPKEVHLIQSKAHYFQNTLAKKLFIKYIPKLKFLIDEGKEKIIRVEKLLEEIKKDNL